jgi:hypothetical protein
MIEGNTGKYNNEDGKDQSVHRWTNRDNIGLGGINAEPKFFQVKGMCNLGGEASLIVGSHPKFLTA